MLTKKQITTNADALVWLIENKAKVAHFLQPITAVIGVESELSPEEMAAAKIEHGEKFDENPTVLLFNPISYSDSIGFIDIALIKRDVFVGKQDGVISWEWDDDSFENGLNICVPGNTTRLDQAVAEVDLYRKYSREIPVAIFTEHRSQSYHGIRFFCKRDIK